MIEPSPSSASALRLKAIFGLVGCCALWGLSFPAMKTLGLHVGDQAPGISTWFVAAATVVVRFGIGAVVLALSGWSRPRRNEVIQGIALGVFSGAGMLFQMDALNFTAASTSAFLTQGYVVLLPLMAALSARAWPPAKTVICVCLSMVGLGVLSGFDWSSLRLGRGETETLFAACAFAGQIQCLGASRFQGNRERVVTTVMFACVAVLLTPLAFGTMHGWAQFGALFSTPLALSLVFLLTFPCTIVAFKLMNRYQPEVSPSEAGIIYGAEPLFASLLALFLPGIFATLARVDYPNEALTVRLFCGGGLVLLANVLLQSRLSFGGPRKSMIDVAK